jgi:hypothetical protein
LSARTNTAHTPDVVGPVGVVDSAGVAVNRTGDTSSRYRDCGGQSDVLPHLLVGLTAGNLVRGRDQLVPQELKLQRPIGIEAMPHHLVIVHKSSRRRKVGIDGVGHRLIHSVSAKVAVAVYICGPLPHKGLGASSLTGCFSPLGLQSLLLAILLLTTPLVRLLATLLFSLLATLLLYLATLLLYLATLLLYLATLLLYLATLLLVTVTLLSLLADDFSLLGGSYGSSCWGFLPFGARFGSLYMGKWKSTPTGRRSTICDQ